MTLLEIKDDRSERVRYDYIDYPIYIRKALLSSYPNYAAPLHWHDDIELVAVLSGEMQYNVNGEIITIRENEGVVVNARQIHFGFSAHKKDCEFICILLHPLMLCATSAYERDYVLPVLQNRNAPFVKLSAGTAWQREIYQNIQTMFFLKDENAAPLKVQKLFYDIWIRLYENLSPENPLKPQNTDLSILKNMIGFIQRNYALKITLADIAASGAVGQSKCCKLFTKYIGYTPNAYLIQYRLVKSTELLKSTDMTIIEVASAAGFSGSSYFAEVFRRWSTQSPSEYRKKNT